MENKKLDYLALVRIANLTQIKISELKEHDINKSQFVSSIIGQVILEFTKVGVEVDAKEYMKNISRLNAEIEIKKRR